MTKFSEFKDFGKGVLDKILALNQRIRDYNECELNLDKIAKTMTPG